MTAQDALDWAVRALSLFNTIAFLWLGLTVLLNAERRVLGTWAVGAGLFVAGLFFAGHSTLVGRDLSVFYGLGESVDLDFWWRASWLLFVSPPFLWYAVIAWYSGLLGDRRHRLRLLLVCAAGVGALLLLGFAGLLPRYADIGRPEPSMVPSLLGIPVAALVYPTYSTLCISLALSALRRPAASKRFMGDLARLRARPWLICSSLVLLVVSLSVGVVAAWLLRWAGSHDLSLFSKPTLTLLLGFDLAISGLLAVVAVLLGRAIVSYEIFTGKALPRGALSGHWRSSLLAAAVYGAALALCIALPVDPTYRLILATVLMSAFLALLSWRTFAEREQGIERLRPFVASQRLYDRLLDPVDPLGADAAVPFGALCDEVLGARVAYLVPLGSLALMAGPALAHPRGARAPTASLGSVAPKLESAGAMCLPLDPAQFGGAVWAVPLWSERGLIGVLLLGEKRDGGLYVQEEVEIARAVGERLIDVQASSEMARRLVGLQRTRMTQTQVLDRSTRRALHDDVLPRVHAALLELSGLDVDEARDAVQTLTEVHRSVSKLLRELPTALAPEVTQLGLVGALREVVDGELAGAFDGVTWRVDPEAARAGPQGSPLAAEVIFCASREALRNAARHGRGRDSARPLHVNLAVSARGEFSVTVEDDGVGLAETRASAGDGGQGLALHGTLMALIGGTLRAEGLPGGGTRVSLALPKEVS